MLANKSNAGFEIATWKYLVVQHNFSFFLKYTPSWTCGFSGKIAYIK